MMILSILCTWSNGRPSLLEGTRMRMGTGTGMGMGMGMTGTGEGETAKSS